MVVDLEHTVWIGLEYFCTEGDELWEMSDEDFSKLGVSEMVKMGLIDRAEDVIDTHSENLLKKLILLILIPIPISHTLIA